MYSGIVYDAMNVIYTNPRQYVLDNSIKPLDDSTWMFGRIFTTKGTIVSKENYTEIDKIRLEIPDAITNETIVLLEAGESKVAHAGDISLLMYKNCGIKGFLTDGYVRDSRNIKYKMKFPCFCKGSMSIDALDIWALTEYKIPIVIKNIDENYIQIYNGDYIYADADGAIIIPLKNCTEVGKEMHRIAIREYKIREILKHGEDALKVAEELGRW